MIRFRRKILYLDLTLFLLFACFLFPFVEWTVDRVVFSQPTADFATLKELAGRLKTGCLLLAGILLILYSGAVWFVMYRLTRPVQKIIDAILPFQDGRESDLPKVVLPLISRGSEMGKLASTLNSLTDQIRSQLGNLTEQKRWTEGILDALGEGVVALNTEAKITFANPSACRSFGLSERDFLGRSLNEWDSDLLKKGHEIVVQVLQTFEPVSQTWEGNNVYLNLIVAPMSHQKGAVLVIQDKTSDFKMVQMGKDFIANASHELRTPITIIRGFAETLQDLPDISPEMLGQITEKIVRTTERLDKLVKGLLTLADVENISQHRFRDCNLIPIVENCRHLLLSAHPEVQVHLRAPIERISILADADLIDLAILNLLENAVKYSSSAAEIDLNIDVRDSCVEIQVIDRGIGIPEADLPLIFGRFYTVDKARSRKNGGAGLGLSIVKTIVEKHRGKIEARSILGQGSSFVIQLPLIKAETGEHFFSK